jgi:fucose permease
MGPYFGAFLGLGVALSFFGPALPTLRAQTGSTVGEIGLVFAAQSLGGLVGSLVAGRLYRRLGGPHLIALAVLALSGGLVAIPVAPSLGAVIALGALIGLGAGTLDVSANTLTPALVAGERLVSSMNALHMCFAIGALATPVLVFASTETSGGLGPVCVGFAAALGALGLLVWRRDRADGARRAAADHEAAGSPPDAWRLGIVAAFFLLYVGLEVCFAGWIATYAHEIGLGGGWATALTATFWAGFLAGRLVMTWRGDRVATGPLLRASVGAATLLAVSIALIGGHAIPLALASGLFGAVIAPQFPTMLTHLHQVIPLTGTVTAWCIAGSAVGGLLLPPAIGGLFDAAGAGALPWTVAGASLASAGVLFAIDRWALAPRAGATLR